VTTKKKPKVGNPFFAFRVPLPLLTRFAAHARKRKKTPETLVREYMAHATAAAKGGAA